MNLTSAWNQSFNKGENLKVFKTIFLFCNRLYGQRQTAGAAWRGRAEQLWRSGRGVRGAAGAARQERLVHRLPQDSELPAEHNGTDLLQRRQRGGR